MHFPCFVLAKQLKKAPQQIAKDLSYIVEHEFIQRVEACWTL
ncbi:hypothetical protein RRV45_10180 [Bacillus sp. DTU_2020_1000418_1_SI_GHA_SEK_038]|nr:hypothetical protein [Bacillus sp. DTU_2020_1000418_1_SI_GHA_SEK_038]WNS77326.1 hypothetical protein RRV45_10180 [Bacillus sp. DTU_2020_1000418_1_SI_GHA_SEK_038]